MRSNRCALVLSAALLAAPAVRAQRPAGKPSAAKPMPAKEDTPKDPDDKQPEPSSEPTSGAPLPAAPPPPAGAEPAKKGEATTLPSEPGTAGEAPVDTRSSAMRTYYQALEKRRMAAASPLSRQRLRDELVSIESKLFDGRRDEAIGDLVYLIESPRFDPFAASDEGRAALFLLGDSLGHAGAYQPARGYLQRLLAADPNDTWYRRAAKSLVELGLESDQPEVFLGDLKKVPPSAPEELRGDIAYLEGRAHERAKRRNSALEAYARVTPRSRFWAQATYLSGLIEVDRRQLKRAENQFCKVADKKLTPKKAPLFGGSDFFRVRDLARLGLGRVAHEQYRFDDARYYYYLVPNDSEHLPEALYEASTTRYEAKDYDGARELMDELRSRDVNHPYEDEAWLLDAYIDLAQCKFPNADAKLNEFLKRYDPVRDAARRWVKDDAAMKRLVEAVHTGADPAGAGLGGAAGTARTLGALIRIDAGYGRASRRLAQLDHQISGLRGAMGELDEAQRRLATPKGTRPQASTPIGQTVPEKVERIEAQIAEVRRLLRDAERSGKVRAADLADLQKQLEALEVRARAARVSSESVTATGDGKGADLPDVMRADRERATRLYNEAQKLRDVVLSQQLALAKDALVRLDRRLSRLLRRARLGRIETVLGKKRALEIEVEALSQGLLPQSVVDSLDAERYLGDDEEYWPFEGEDWEDEYVGGEGLR
jgi:tetratricopeptide (TPR) repeat protein